MSAFFYRSDGIALVSELIQLCVSEIESHVNGDLDEIKNVKYEAENEDDNAERTRSFKRIAERHHLYGLARNTERITYKKEHLEEEALALSGSRNIRLAYRNRP